MKFFVWFGIILFYVIVIATANVLIWIKNPIVTGFTIVGLIQFGAWFSPFVDNIKIKLRKIKREETW